MFNKRVRPQQDNQVSNGIYFGQIIDAQEKVFASQYHTSGFRDVLCIRTKVFHADGETTVFYNVNWDWNNYRFVKALEGLEVMPDKGEEFDPQLLSGMNVVVVIANETKNGVTYTNITSVRKAKPEDGFGPSVFDEMAG